MPILFTMSSTFTTWPASSSNLVIFFRAMKRSSPTQNCAAALMVPFGSKVSITASL